MSLTVTMPIAKAAMLCLSERWPRAVAFAELRDEARARLGWAPGNREADTRELGGALLTAYAGGATRLVELSLCPPRFASIPGDRPEVSPLARLQAVSNPEVTNLRHQRVTLDEFDRQFLPYLDGRHTRSEQLEVLLACFGQKRLSLERNGQSIRTTHEARPILAESLDRQLTRLAGAALLMP